MNYATSNHKASVKIHLSHFYFKKKNVEAPEMFMVVDGFPLQCPINISGTLWPHNLSVPEAPI